MYNSGLCEIIIIILSIKVEALDREKRGKIV